MQLTENFALHEFRCNDGTDVPDEYMDNVQLLADNLQIIRNEINQPMILVSGYRSPEYNKSIGSRPTSQHRLAKAADIVVKDMTPKQVWEVIIRLIKEKKIHSGGVGLYTTFVHYDVRGRNARWYGKGARPSES